MTFEDLLDSAQMSENQLKKALESMPVIKHNGISLWLLNFIFFFLFQASYAGFRMICGARFWVESSTISTTLLLRNLLRRFDRFFFKFIFKVLLFSFLLKIFARFCPKICPQLHSNGSSRQWLSQSIRRMEVGFSWKFVPWNSLGKVHQIYTHTHTGHS